MSNPTISNTDVLKHKALTVRLKRKKINRNKGDKLLAEELHLLKNVKEASALRVNKSLFPVEATKAYQQLITEAGKYFYDVTTPWDDNHWRLLSIDLYKSFTKKMKDFTRRFREAVLVFVETFAHNIELMRPILGDAFNMDDYREFLYSDGTVNREAILEKFSLEVEYGTVSDADDLRANLTEADREVIAQHITEQNTIKFARSQEHIITKLHDHINAIHERLSKSENIFRDTLIGNLEDLCDLIPKMNIAGDPALNKLAAEAKARLCKFDPQTLRDNTRKRKAISNEADDLLDGMKGLI